MARESVRIGHKLFSVVTINENDLYNEEVLRLLKIFEGNVLKTDNQKADEFIKRYLFDISPYVKRAILSSLVRKIREDRGILSVCVKDRDFYMSDEYLSLAENSRKLSLVSGDNLNVNKFCEHCFNSYGLNIGLTDDCYGKYDVFIDLDELNGNNSAFMTVNGIRMLIYADESYFELNDDVLKLIRYNVPLEYACAAYHM